MARGPLTLDAYAAGVIAADRTIVARAITLVESRKPDQAALGQQLLTRLLPRTGAAQRVGITGVPGVGKSTFIEALGLELVAAGRKVAVLAVDPSSAISGGSILADKSRMTRLAQHPAAYIRPSPSARSLGGVGRRTRETMLLCEAAGYDVVLIETVGVGQSETMVADMVDFFLVLMLAGAGDEIQGIKKGIIEHADLIAVNKADGDNVAAANAARHAFGSALTYLRPRSTAWRPEAVTVSALTGLGLTDLWAQVEAHRATLTASGDWHRRRREQLRGWMWSAIEDRLLDAFRENADVRVRLADVERDVLDGATTPTEAATSLLASFGVDRDLGD